MKSAEAIKLIQYEIDYDKSSLADGVRFAKQTEEAFNMAVRTLEKADKYKWHILKDNPNDLPICHQVLVARRSLSNRMPFYSLAYYGIPFVNYNQGGKVFYECDSEYGDYVIDDVIAWKEIEPYEVEE